MKVYFFCYPHGPADKAGYQHQIISLAEGFEKMGVNFRGNVNYWLKSVNENDYLIKKHQPVDLNEYDVVVFSSMIYVYGREDILPDNLFSKERKYKLIFIDSADGFKTYGYEDKFRNIDWVLKSHYCDKYDHPENFVPWQFGLTDRIIQYASKNQLPFEERQKKILSNFRVYHQLRTIFEDISVKHFYHLYPKNSETNAFDEESENALDYIFWKQTGKRHYPTYYKTLNQNLVSNAIGGYPKKSIDHSIGLPHRIVSKFSSRINFFKYDRIFQFDSWRFWESLVSGCCTLHVDFQKYGLVLPVAPVNGLHYIGVDLDNPQKAVEILKDEDQLRHISENGKSWVLENYSPQAIAERFLKLVKEPSLIHR